MAVFTQIPHCDIVKNKSRHNVVVNKEASKLKEFGLPSLSCNSAKRKRRVGSKQGRRAIVASSPPREDTVIATKPLFKEDLIGYLASGCKPKEKWRIGTEHEKFGFEFDTLRPLKYEEIAKLLNGIAERFQWDKILEDDNVIALKQGQQMISLEPGGQVELSGAPVETLYQTCAEINSHIYQVKAIAEKMGIGFLGIGFQPKWRLKDMPIMPMRRFDIIKKYHIHKFDLPGLDTMFRTCTVQVNLDFSSEADMIKKFRTSLSLQPIATAMFANAPFTEGKPNGYLSIRSQQWSKTDSKRTGMLPFVFNNSFGFEQYVDYALDVPMYIVYRNKKYIDCTGMSFRVRLKRYLEMRGADGGPLKMLWALPAFWVGLLYVEISLQNVVDMTSDWTIEEKQMLRNEVPKTGLKTLFRGRLLKYVAEDVVKWSKDGLERRGFNESGFLNKVAEIVATGNTPAENCWRCTMGSGDSLLILFLSSYATDEH